MMKNIDFFGIVVVLLIIFGLYVVINTTIKAEDFRQHEISANEAAEARNAELSKQTDKLKSELNNIAPRN